VERKRGHVVNVASLAGLVAARRMSVYATTKFAVVGFSEVLRAELEPEGIGVTTLCPGVIDTPITRTAKHTGDLAAQPEYRRASMEAYRQRRYGPQRVAAAIVEAVRENKGLLPVSPESWLFYYMKRFAPGVAARVLNHDSLQPKPKTAAS
jgi:short-subunit dehydrogenase